MSNGTIPHPTRIAALEEIVRDVYGETICALCGRDQFADEPRHHERCVWLRAKGMQR